MKHILFDTDGVIVHCDMWSNEYARRSGISTDIMKPFFRDIFGNCIIGKADLKEKIQPFLKEWKWTGTIDEYLKEWFQYENQVDFELLDKIQELRKSGIKCHIATNQEKYRLEFLKNEMGFSKNFDSIFCSCELGFRKPQKEFYERIIHALNVDFDEVLYFDDAIENVETAKNLGIQVVFYRGIVDFERTIQGI